MYNNYWIFKLELCFYYLIKAILCRRLVVCAIHCTVDSTPCSTVDSTPCSSVDSTPCSTVDSTPCSTVDSTPCSMVSIQCYCNTNRPLLSNEYSSNLTPLIISVGNIFASVSLKFLNRNKVCNLMTVSNVYPRLIIVRSWTMKQAPKYLTTKYLIPQICFSLVTREEPFISVSIMNSCLNLELGTDIFCRCLLNTVMWIRIQRYEITDKM